VIRDPYFDLPLLLQTGCCGGKLLWAYNLDHLAFLEAFVAARLRERSDAVRAGDGYRRMSMVTKLPAWLKSAKHRDEILTRIVRLRATVRQSKRRTCSSTMTPRPPTGTSASRRW
jgi:hypothetical protein